MCLSISEPASDGRLDIDGIISSESSTSCYSAVYVGAPSMAVIG